MLKTDFTPFPTLITRHLILRPLNATDDNAIFIHRSDDKVNTYLDNFRHDRIEESRAFIARVQREITEQKTILWVLTEKGNDTFIGTVCFWNMSPEAQKAETGYTLDSSFHNKGYVSEALARIIAYGFETMNLQTIEAFTHKENQGSIRVLQKNGFTQDRAQAAPNNRILFVLTKEKLE